MPRARITANPIPFQGSDEQLTGTAGDATNDMDFINDGEQLILIDNADASPVAITFVSVADQWGRTQDEVVTVPAGEKGFAGPFTPGIWNQTGGVVHVDMVSDTSLTLYSIKPTRAT